MPAVRNNPSKPGKKPASTAPERRKEDEVKLREQWEWAYEEWHLRRAAVKRSGRTQMTPQGRRTHPNVGLLDTAAKHLLAVSRALADVLGLASEDEHRRGAVLSITTDKKKAGR